MTTYKVEVRQLSPPKDGDRYPESSTIYEQTVTDLNLASLIAVVNGLVAPNPPKEQIL